MRRTTACAIAACGLLVALPDRAAADVTAFIGVSATPESRMLRGASFGFGFVIIGFEFEYADIIEDTGAGLPSLRTGSGNVLLQTPIEVSGVSLYATTGGGTKR